MNKPILTFLLVLSMVTIWSCRPQKGTTSTTDEVDTTYAVVEFDTSNMVQVADTPSTPPPPPPPKGHYVYGDFESPTKGTVDYVAFLPPGFKYNDTTSYPLMIYLYGQGGNEYSFSRVVRASQLSDWMKLGEVEPMVIICVRGAKILNDEAWHKQKIQWYTSENETLLTSDAEGELRHFCRQRFRAGLTSDMIALEGHSRGATGTLHYALKYPEKFSSFLANSFVSDYALTKLKNNARRNQRKLNELQPPIKMEIGAADHWVTHYKRKGSQILHGYLKSLKIEHSYDTISGADHHYYYLWNAKHPKYGSNGLAHLKFHQQAWFGKEEEEGT